MADVSNHPSSAVLLDYVNGSISFAHSCVIGTHLLSCSACQEVVDFWETVGTSLLSGKSSVRPPSGLLDDCLATIDKAVPNGTKRRSQARARKNALPAAFGDLCLGRLRWLAPGIRHGTLWRDEHNTLHYIRVKPGVTLPAHRHRGLELTCVLSGAYRDEDTLYVPGDLSEEEEDDGRTLPRERDHLLTAEPSEDCVCVMATTGRLRFSGWMARLLQPVMPF